MLLNSIYIRAKIAIRGFDLIPTSTLYLKVA